jgi:hypothetical protein
MYLASEVWLPQDFMQSPLFITFPPDMEKFLILKGKMFVNGKTSL